jgi:hypothetical protein
MSFLDDLMGGGGESKSQTTLDPKQQEYLQDLWGRAQGQLGQSTVAPQTQQFQDYLQSVGGFSRQAQDMQQQAMGQAGQYGQIGGQAQDYLSNVFGQGGFQAPMQQGVDMGAVSSMVNNPLLDQQIQASTRDIGRNLWEQEMPGIASQAVGSGNVGSTRRGVAEGIAQRGAEDRASDVAAQMRGQAYEQALGIGAQQAGANQQSQLSSNQLNQQLASGTFGQAGQLGQGSLGQGFQFGMGALTPQQQAAQMSQGYAQQQTMDPWTQLQLYQGALGQPITLSESTQAGGSQGAGGLLSGIGGIMQAWPSDERLKSDITRIGELPSGAGIYRWNWNDKAEALGLHGEDSGVIAQEIVGIAPDAVTTGEHGYLMVDYGRI